MLYKRWESQTVVNSARPDIIANYFCFEAECFVYHLSFERDADGMFQIANILPRLTK